MGISAGCLERMMELCEVTALPATSPPGADLEAQWGPLQIWANHLLSNLIKPTNSSPLCGRVSAPARGALQASRKVRVFSCNSGQYLKCSNTYLAKTWQ